MNSMCTNIKTRHMVKQLKLEARHNLQPVELGALGGAGVGTSRVDVDTDSMKAATGYDSKGDFGSATTGARTLQEQMAAGRGQELRRRAPQREHRQPETQQVPEEYVGSGSYD